jgi:hypothetical protein
VRGGVAGAGSGGRMDAGMIHIEFTDESGTTVKATAPDSRLDEVLARAQVRIFGESTAEATRAEDLRWAQLQARWSQGEKKMAKKGRR